MPRNVLAWMTVAVLCTADLARAQYSEVPRPLPVPAQLTPTSSSTTSYLGATQIGRRLFVGGSFHRLATPTGAATVLSPDGTAVPGRFPFFAGAVHEIVPDNAGGWLVVGAFASVNGLQIANFARVAPDRSVDARYRVFADGQIRRVAIAHGRIYLLGDFSRVNGAVRHGLAALDAATGALSSWGAAFEPRHALAALSISSLGVYVTTLDEGGHLWGLDAATGRVMFDRRAFVTALAATSARVYVGTTGYQRPVWAVDSRTGQDSDWAVGPRFEPVPAKYVGGDLTRVTALLVADSRVYFAGRFRTTDGREHLAAVDVGSGQGVHWRPVLTREGSQPQFWLTRVGAAVVVGSVFRVTAYDVTTALPIGFFPDTDGLIATVAPAPEGVVVGGWINGVGGVARDRLASISLDTFEVEPWTSTPSGPMTSPIVQLATDGAWLFTRSADIFVDGGGSVAKVDPVSGAVVAERTLPLAGRMQVAGGEVFVLSRHSSFGIAALRIQDWSYRDLPTTFDIAELHDLAVAGDTIYLAGRFFRVNGEVLNARLIAVHRVTGALLPWRPAADADVWTVRTHGGRVFVAGEFRLIGGQRRRGLAELDPITGAARSWDPDVHDGTTLGGGYRRGLEIAADGTLFVDDRAAQVFAAGQVVPSVLVYSTATGQRLPWRPRLPLYFQASQPQVTAALPDCVLIHTSCLGRATPTPTALRVTQAGHVITLGWDLAPSAPRTGVRVEVGRAEGDADLFTADLPADQQTFTTPAPAGRYFARVRALAGYATGMPTADVSFAVGPPDVPGAPLDLTARTRGRFVTLAWTPPSTGAPPQYVIEAGTAPGRRDIGGLALPGAATSFSIDPPQGKYWVRLLAVNANGASAPSRDVFFDLLPNFTCGQLPPTNLAATVSGRTVTFTWQPPGDGADLPPRLEAGSVPGASDLAVINMPRDATTWSVAAPPGTYYVRLVNACYPASSNEVQVVVP